MKLFKKIGLWFLTIVAVLALIATVFVIRNKPDYSGSQLLEKLADTVTVRYDTYGIPHIYAENELDAFRSLGYVHAQDRLWQMELLRRIGKGGLSEVFGADLIKTDRFFLALGIDDASAETLATLDRNRISVQLTQAYLDGINAFIANGPTPVEFYLTGLEKKPFELKDVYNTMGYMAFSFAIAHKSDPLLTDIKDKLGTAYLADLQIDVDPATTWIKNYPAASADSLSALATASVMKSLESLSIPLFEGSNSWVLAPEKTKKGKVIFANDPHIGYAQPSVWYEAHLSTPSYEKYGYHLAGVPFPILGHDRKLAYGMTMFENDDVDFYYEEIDPTDSTRYRIGDAWEPIETITKTIKVKDAEEVVFSYKKTNKGPVLNGIADQINGERPVSMWWIYTKHENRVIDALYKMSHAQNINDFRNALPNIHAPGLNIMYGDAEGNVAWWATAKLYRIADSLHTKFIQETGTGLSIDKDYIDFSENPQAENPPWGYVYSANNQPDSIAGMLYPGYYLPENRAKRIVDLLDKKKDWDRESVGAMLNDVTSPVDVAVVKDLIKTIDTERLDAREKLLLERLKVWQGEYSTTSIEATVYTGWVYQYLEHTFKDELGEALFTQFITTHFLKRLIAPMAHSPESVWWDDISTADTRETQQDIFTMAFKQALSALETKFGADPDTWTWEKVHTLEHGHPIGQVKALRSFFNVGPFPIAGTREVINNTGFGYDGSVDYPVNVGPSTRRIIDFSDVENSISILPTGQSGNPFSKHYQDQAEMYVQGKFRKMMMNEAEIKETAKDVLTFYPLKSR